MPDAETPATAVNPNRLFLASCLSLISTSVAFGVLTSNMEQFQNHFGLTLAQTGVIGGVTLWGFTISIFILGPLVDALGIKLEMRIALICHLLGVLAMVFAPSFTVLFIGGLLIALGNGTVEAACNPLVATLYPNDKTTKLNQFHVWFPGGIVLGGLAAYLLDNTLFSAPDAKVIGLVAWQFKLLLVLIPTVIYGLLFMGQSFPKTERVQSGLTFGEMVSACFNPLFILLFVCMGLTASLELGPGRWMGQAMGEVMSWAGNNAGILVLVYGTGLMAVLRYFAGPIVHKLSPTGMLLGSAVLGGIGLFLLSMVNSPVLVFVAATIFFVGVCYFWPTMLGFVAERTPKTGALGLALMGGMGLGAVGLITTPLMGKIGDHYVHAEYVAEADDVKSALSTAAPLLSGDNAEPLRASIAQVITAAELPEGATAAAIQGAASNLKGQKLTAPAGGGKGGGAASVEADPSPGAVNPVASAAAEPLNDLMTSANTNGMRWGFRWTAALALPLIVVFGFLYVRDKASGGYQTVEIVGSPNDETPRA